MEANRIRPSSSRAVSPLLAAALAIVLLALPFVLTGYYTFQATMVVVYTITLVGLNILTGYNGQISLGHGAFYALGAYTTAILMDQFGVPYWATLPVAAVLCFGVGFLFGFPALRLSGHYLALATFSLAVAMPQLLKYRHFEGWVGGVQGVVILKPAAPFDLPLDSDQWLYFFTLAVALAMIAMAHNFLRGSIGRAIVAIRDQPLAAESMGINLPIYKALTFGVSALYAGVGGALGAICIQFVAPDSFGVFLSVSFLVGIVVGGLATIRGAIFGAIFIQFVPNIADSISKAAPWAVYGAILIAFVFVMPKGIAGGISGIPALRARFWKTKTTTGTQQ